MTWKRREDGVYYRGCRYCRGSGIETLDKRFTHCICPMDGLELVEHPANSGNDPERKYYSTGYNIMLCNQCKMFWCVWFELDDDSMDIPSPECLGREIPKDDWSPSNGT